MYHLRKRHTIKIILGILLFLVFLGAITKKASSPLPDNTLLQNHQNNSYATSPTKSSTSVVKSERHHTCDIAVSNNSNLAQRFPHIIIIGFGKAGTRALYQMIRIHPDVVGPANEVRFFSNNAKYSQGLRAYISFMPKTISTAKTIEKSPDYLIRPVAARRLKKALDFCQRNDQIKFIVVFREPFQRAVSEYLHWKLTVQQMGKTLKDFERLALKRSGEVNNFRAQVNTSIYSYHLRNWLKVFEMKTMCFVNGGNLVKDPYTVVKKLEKCLELRDFIRPKHFYYNKVSGYYCPVNRMGSPKCLGPSKGRLHPKINKDVELKLRRFFQLYNKELYNITGINFGWS